MSDTGGKESIRVDVGRRQELVAITACGRRPLRLDGAVQMNAKCIEPVPPRPGERATGAVCADVAKTEATCADPQGQATPVPAGEAPVAAAADGDSETGRAGVQQRTGGVRQSHHGDAERGLLSPGGGLACSKSAARGDVVANSNLEQEQPKLFAGVGYLATLYLLQRFWQMPMDGEGYATFAMVTQGGLFSPRGS